PNWFLTVPLSIASALSYIYPLSLRDALPISADFRICLGFFLQFRDVGFPASDCDLIHLRLEIDKLLHPIFVEVEFLRDGRYEGGDRKSTRLNSSHVKI